MAVTVEMQNTGDPTLQRELEAIIEHIFADRTGDWWVLILGSQANDRWEMKITGPNAFERSYTLEGTGGQHERASSALLLRGWCPADRNQDCLQSKDRSRNITFLVRTSVTCEQY